MAALPVFKSFRRALVKVTEQLFVKVLKLFTANDHCSPSCKRSAASPACDSGWS